MLKSIVSRISNIGAHPDDLPELRLRKSLVVHSSFTIAFAAIIWGLIYLIFDERLASTIPISYAVFSIISLILFAVTRRFKIFRVSQLLLVLFLPFFLMIALGGFINSGAVVIWSFLALLGALFSSDPKKTVRWFIAYVLILLLSGFLQPFARAENNLPEIVNTLFFVFNIGVVTGISYFLLKYFMQQKEETMQLLEVERGRSESLLLNILPKKIADILKKEAGVIADRYDNASILFADLAGFTPLSAQMEPEETVALLNEIYSHFDALSEKYGVEKIRTIGDNYMVASGVPTTRTDHAQALAHMALDILEYTKQLPAQNGTAINFRIGINSGPLVAGVIGQKKFHYDVWGDTVNTASRMESHGVAGKIQMTAATHKLLKDEFRCEKRGVLDIKGKGEMETWFLVGRKR